MTFLTLGVFSAQSVCAILPPLYQTSNEIKAILESKELGQKLGSGDVIQTIQKNESGYEIITNKHRLQVDVSYVSNKGPGPAEYKFIFKTPQTTK